MIAAGSFLLQSADETESLGRSVGAAIDDPTILLLIGDLGAGKTLFTRGLAAGLGIDPDEVSSPTFSLVNEYSGGRLPLIHLDIYRLDGAHALAALYDLGLEEILDRHAVVAIEWADRLGSFPVPKAWRIDIAYDGDDRRRVDIAEVPR